VTLVDTSVWVDHLRRGEPRLATLLDGGEVLCHPFVIGELACGDLARRQEVLHLLGNLARAEVAGHDEVMSFLGSRNLSGRGLGWIDAHLLASAGLSRVGLWTTDRRLDRIARELNLTAS
jgi:predicted nucleic acid-binding protein